MYSMKACGVGGCTYTHSYLRHQMGSVVSCNNLTASAGHRSRGSSIPVSEVPFSNLGPETDFAEVFAVKLSSSTKMRGYVIN
jgi:hypothetical protein